MTQDSGKNRLREFGKAVIVFLGVLGVGFIAFSLSVEQIGWGQTAGFGIVQVLFFLMGISALTLSAYLLLRSLRPKDAPQSLQADVSVRLIGSGLVFAYISGFSDLLQIGTHLPSPTERAYFGPWQFTGVTIGIVAILTGLYLYHTSKGRRESSLFDFLLPDNSADNGEIS